MDTLFLSKGFSFLLANLTFSFSINLIANQEHDNIALTLLCDLLEPVPQIIECLHASYIIGEEYAVSATVENFGYRFERFLARGVPDLKFENLGV